MSDCEFSVMIIIPIVAFTIVVICGIYAIRRIEKNADKRLKDHDGNYREQFKSLNKLK